MKITKYVLGMLKTNTYLVSDEYSKKCFIIDPAEACKKLKDEIARNSLSPEYIILTHGHGDHTGGIDDLKNTYPWIKLLACEKERDFLLSRSLSHGKGGIKADVEVKDGDEMDIGTIHLKFIETPGHTPGGMCILAGDVLFSGDTLFRTSVGRTDIGGGNLADLLSSIKNKLFILPNETIVYPGHEESTSIGYEKRYNPFV